MVDFNNMVHLPIGLPAVRAGSWDGQVRRQNLAGAANRVKAQLSEARAAVSRTPRHGAAWRNVIHQFDQLVTAYRALKVQAGGHDRLHVLARTSGTEHASGWTIRDGSGYQQILDMHGPITALGKSIHGANWSLFSSQKHFVSAAMKAS